jgi:hypothetical protein
MTGKNSVTVRISPALNNKIKAYQKRLGRLKGSKVSYVEATQWLSREIKL